MVGTMIIDTLPDSIWLSYKFTFLVNFSQDDTFCVVRKSQSARDLAIFRVAVSITLNLVK